MENKVIGAGIIFLGSGCGPALSRDQQEYLKGLSPEQFYPMSRLLEMLEAAGKKDPRLVHATGRRWGSAIKSEFDKQGISDIKQALHTLCQVYQDHHQGEVGQIEVEELGETEVILKNGSPYPHDMISGAYEALATALGAQDLTAERMDSPAERRITWSLEEDDA